MHARRQSLSVQNTPLSTHFRRVNSKADLLKCLCASQKSNKLRYIIPPFHDVLKFALDLDISPVHYRALWHSKWEPLLFIRDAPTRQILNVTEADCSFNLLKEWKNLTVGGGLSCHSFLERLLFFSNVFFPVRVDSAGFIGAVRCVSRAAFLARTLVFGWGAGARDVLRATENETRKCASQWSSPVWKELFHYLPEEKWMSYKHKLLVFCFNLWFSKMSKVVDYFVW